MKNKNSLDILEEQLNKILAEYQGFTDGAQYVGSNNKGPYEDRDVQWNKKVYARDSKNLKILIGKGSKKQKHVKSGTPYTNDPPKRMPANKLSAPPAVLQEEEANSQMSDRDAFLIGLQNAKPGDVLKFSVKKEISLPIGLGSFCKDKTYKANITPQGRVEIETSSVIIGSNCPDGDIKPLIVKPTKEEIVGTFKSKIPSNVQLCDTIDCKNSNLNNVPVEDVIKSIKTNNAPPDDKNKSTTQTKQQNIKYDDERKVGAIFSDEEFNDSQAVDSIITNVSSGTDPATAIKQEFGYHPLAQKFADDYYEVLQKSIDELKNPNEKQIAVMMGVLFKNILMIPVNLGARISDAIPSELVTNAEKALEKVYDDLGPGKFEDLQNQIADLKAEILKLKRDPIKYAKSSLAAAVTSTLSELKPSVGTKNKIILIGNQQIGPLKNEFKSFFISKRFQVEETNVFSGKNTPQTLLNDTGFTRFLDTNKDSIGAFFISMGDENGSQLDWSTNGFKLIELLKEKAPDCQIVWIGATPVQKVIPNYSTINEKRKSNNTALSAMSLVPTNSFLFFNPFDYLGDNEQIAVTTNGVQLNQIGAKKIFDGAATGQKIVTIESVEQKDIDDTIKKYNLDPAGDVSITTPKIRDKYGPLHDTNPSDPSSFRGYLTMLFNIFEDNKEKLKAWSIKDSEKYIEKMAIKYGIPYYFAYGIIDSESSLLPVGINMQKTFKNSGVEVAYRNNSSAYGMGQNVGKSYNPKSLKLAWPHYMLWIPEYGIEAGVAVAASNFKSSNGDVEKASVLYCGEKSPGSGIPQDPKCLSDKMKSIEAAKKKFGEI